MYLDDCKVIDYQGHKLYQKIKGTALTGLVTDKGYFLWLGFYDEEEEKILPTSSSKFGIPSFKLRETGKRTLTLDNGAILARGRHGYVLSNPEKIRDDSFLEFFD